MDEIARDVAKILLEIRAVTLSPSKPYRFVSGIYSPIYCDNRLLMSYPGKRGRIIDHMARVAAERKLDFDIVAGIASSGIPHAAWLAERLQKPMIYIRKESKEHGKENLIEGNLDKGKKVIIVEDLVSTGGSSVAGVEAVRRNGGVVGQCLAIFTYGMAKAKDAFREAGCELIPLCDFSTLIKVAGDMKYIGKEDVERALEWSKDPQNWGRRMGFE
jgi:orotate phosphoribosyltransferase